MAASAEISSSGGRTGGGILQDYDILEFLGAGSFGNVHKIHHIKSGFILAMKTMFKDYESMDRIDRNETDILFSLGRHANIVHLYNILISAENDMVIIMEYCEMDLGKFLKKYPLCGLTVRLDVARQVAAGVEFLHSRNPPIIHKDLKPQNILLNEHPHNYSFVVKIADFGLSMTLESRDATQGLPVMDLHTFTSKIRASARVSGTSHYLAPEYVTGDSPVIFEDQPLIGPSVDVYAMGQVFAELFDITIDTRKITLQVRRFVYTELKPGNNNTRMYKKIIKDKISQIAYIIFKTFRIS